MVSINSENVIKTAESGLKKKAFGGVSLESAKEAIQKLQMVLNNLQRMQ